MVNPDPIDAELEMLLATDETSEGSNVPAILIRRAKDIREPLVGKRARFLMTSHTSEGDWLSYGWKDGLRIVSEPTEDLLGLGEAGVWIQEERDYYGDCDATNRFAVGLSRLWTEQYISAPSVADVSPQQVWIENLNRDPNAPEVRPLQPAEGYPDPVGRRVVAVGEEITTDLRAVGPVRITSTGDLAITVMAERDWYRWVRDYPAEPHPTLRWVSAADVWME